MVDGRIADITFTNPGANYAEAPQIRIEAPQFGAEWLLAVLTRHAMDPRRVIIELTEQQDIEDLPQLQRNLVALQRAGVRVAVDDVDLLGVRSLRQPRHAHDVAGERDDRPRRADQLGVRRVKDPGPGRQIAWLQPHELPLHERHGIVAVMGEFW